MKIELLAPGDSRWEEVAEYAKRCSWRAGAFLAEAMQNGGFSDWERVLIAVENGAVCGYCTVAKTDCIPQVTYTPYIGYLFVGEEHRGNRLSQKLIECAMEYLKEIGFEAVYLVSDHENFYEKYGFSVIDRKKAPWGETEKIYMRKLSEKR